MTKFRVYENDMPAVIRHVDCWKNNEFDTFDEAVQYARLWTGKMGSLPLNMPANCPVDYNGYGDMIEIRKETV